MSTSVRSKRVGRMARLVFSVMAVTVFSALLLIGCGGGGDKSGGGGADGGGSAVNKGKNVNSLEMVKVKGGTFMMGCTAEQGDECGSDENPAHNVTVSDFSIGKYEVTQKLWVDIMEANPSDNRGDNLPVENVSWDEVQMFIKMLNKKTGKNYRLPTEAEWEYAARGGNKSKGYKYSGGNDAVFVAWYKDNSGGTTHSVGTREPNELGIYDMSGNVWEWVNDRYSSNYYSSSSGTNPTGPNSGSSRVIRGGVWPGGAGGGRVSGRDPGDPGGRNGNLGFRLVLSP